MNDTEKTKEQLIQELAILRQQAIDHEMLNIKRKQTEIELEKRLTSLTKPLGEIENITFEDLFDLEDIQRLQDEFSMATGVASLITRPDGTPITTPSNFCRLCNDVIRKTEKGRANCYRSDAILGQFHPTGPIIHTCISGGLWDAGSAISVQGKHIANWLIGQVRDNTQTEEKIRLYAQEIGADEEEAVEAFREVPSMSREQFGWVAKALFTLANQLSSIAYKNVQQARFINERKRLEREKLELTLERERMRILANFITQTSHQFRTPLSIINVSTYLLTKSDNSSNKQRHIDNIKIQVKDITKLVDALNTLTKLDIVQEIDVEEIDLCATVEAIHTKMHHTVLQSKHIDIELSLEVEHLKILANIGYLQQAIEAIIDNAIRFTPEGGYIHIRVVRNDNHAVIEVTDTGTGIDEENLPHIFERFYRADKAGTTRGFGLGLPIAKAIIQLHNGNIEVHSEPRKGSTFRIMLPIASTPP